MRGLRAAGSIRANSPKLKNHRLSRWIFIVLNLLYCEEEIHFEFLSVRGRVSDLNRTMENADNE